MERDDVEGGHRLAVCTGGARLTCLREREQLFRGQYLVHVEQDHEPAIHLGHRLYVIGQSRWCDCPNRGPVSPVS